MNKKLKELLAAGTGVSFYSICGGETFYAYSDDENVYGYGKTIEDALDMLYDKYFGQDDSNIPEDFGTHQYHDIG